MRFFSCDWGTSSFRLRLVALEERRVLDEWRSEDGVKAIRLGLGDAATPAERAAAFARHLAGSLEHLTRRQGRGVAEGPAWVMVSGMASSSVGWCEVPYARAPVSLDGEGLRLERIPPNDVGLDPDRVWLISGVRTATDIMRGEECELMGLSASGAGWDPRGACVVVLPGTHAKHVWLRDGQIVDFRTYMTGELFEVLSRHSLLRMSVEQGAANAPLDAVDRAAFSEGVTRAGRDGLARSLFRVRTRSVLDAASPRDNGWFLSGVLIGAEMSELLRGTEGDSTLPILLGGAPRVSEWYALALETLGASDRLRRVPAGVMENATARAHARLLERILARGGGKGGSTRLAEVS